MSNQKTVNNESLGDEFGLTTNGNNIIEACEKAKRTRKVKDGYLNIPNAKVCMVPCFQTKEEHAIYMTHEEVDKFDFTNTFNEYIIGQDYVHLYFDFDTISNLDEACNAWDEMEKIKTVFGDFSVCGYSNDKEFAEAYELRYQPENEKHFCSMHVVYYETCISTKDLRWITYYNNKAFQNVDMSTLKIDPIPYNIVPKKDNKTGEMQPGHQKFRHGLSDKQKDYTAPPEKTAGNIITADKRPSTQIVQVRGNEKIITKEEWSKIFKIIPKTFKAAEPKQLKTEEKKPKKSDEDEFDDEELIMFTDEEMQEFLSYFESTNEDCCKSVNALYSSPYSREYLLKNLTEWSNKTEHNNPNDFNAILNTWYKQENTNKWFNVMVKKLPPEIASDYIKKYRNAIDWSININNSNYTFTQFSDEIVKNQFEKKDFHKLINKIRGFFGIVLGHCYLKQQNEKGQIIIEELTKKRMKEIFDDYKPIKKNKATLTKIVKKHSMFFIYKSCDISKENSPDTINMFQGCTYPEIITDDFTIIKPFLKHIEDVICDNNEEKYNYMMKWWANIFQNITVKNCTMPIVYGAQGVGKSFVFETFCSLLGVHAEMNISDLDKVFGKFNSIGGQKLAILINEAQEAGEKFKHTSAIKAMTTQKTIVIEKKGIDARSVESWTNYFLVTNNSHPILEEKGNRRMIYYKTNDTTKSEGYYQKLFTPIQPVIQGPYNKEFMGTLLHYMRTQVDVNGFYGEDLIQKINKDVTADYNEQLERQYNDLDKVDKYVVDRIDEFRNGIDLDTITIEGYSTIGISKKLNLICNKKRVRKNGKQVMRYFIKEEDQIANLYNIIKYKEHQKSKVDIDEDNQAEEVLN